MHIYTRSTARDSRRASSIRLEQHTKIYASMCPDEILDHYDDYDTRIYYTTLMLGDISGWPNYLRFQFYFICLIQFFILLFNL